MELRHNADMGRCGMMENGPITIKPGDIIRRPSGLAETTKPPGGGSFNVGSIKSTVKEIKELVEMVKDMGLDIDLNFLGLGKGKPAAQAAPESKGPQISKKQVIGFMNLIKLRYGDLPLSEIIASLEKDLPDQGSLL